MESTYEGFIHNILVTRGRFACADEYHERHHIVPKCLGGSNDLDNLIDLYANEHFIAHKLLANENPDNTSLVFAWTCMAFPNNKFQHRYEVTPDEYENAKKALSHVMTGRVVSEETKMKLRNSKKGFSPSMEARKKCSDALKGRKFTDDHRRKLSKALKGRIFSDDHKANISKAKTGRPISSVQRAALEIVWKNNIGRKHTEEAKAKISTANKGRIVSQETRKKLSESHKGKRLNYFMKKVAQFDLNSGCLIKEWDCITDASLATGIDNSSIGKCAKGKYKHAGGYLWKLI